MHYGDRLLGHIKRAEQATQAVKAAVLKPFGLTPAQQNILAVVNEFPGVTSAELARRVLVTPQTITSTVNRLERDGFIRRAVHPVHRSLIELSLTGRGHEIFAAADAAVASYDQALRQAITPEELELLQHLLDRVSAAAALIDTSPGGPASQCSAKDAYNRAV